MHLKEFHGVVDATLPPASAMEGDAIGLQVESQRQSATNVLVTMELTDEVLQEAVGLKCDAILAFHPLIYAPLKSIDLSNRVGRLVAGLIRNDIALIVVHTAFDAFPQGTNTILAEKLGVSVDRFLVNTDVDGHGMGIIGTLEIDTTMDTFVRTVSEVCGGPCRYVPSPTEKIRSIAIVAGSGMSFYGDALSSGVDVLVTADIKYHDFHAAKGHIGLIDPGHYEMERFVPDGLISALHGAVDNRVTLHRSTVVTNPVRYSSPLQRDQPTLQQDQV